MKLFFPGQDVPEWLQKIEPIKPDSVVGTIRFGTLAVVWQKGGGYHVRAIFPADAIMVLRNCTSCNLTGQKPPGGTEPVVFHMGPFIPGWMLGLAAGLILGAYWLGARYIA